MKYQVTNHNFKLTAIQAKTFIWAGILTAIISGIVTFTLALSDSKYVTRWGILDAAIIFVLAYGLYKRSLIAAIALFFHRAISATLFSQEYGTNLTYFSGLQVVYLIALLGVALHPINDNLVRNNDENPSDEDSL